ncbi:glycosyltransferase family 2 protein, partial [Clostridium botulinum]|nr:glycosyltransferase family 2 protein [Clostridium botulinum]
MFLSNISVIIPCYNCEKFIEKTVNSILNQTIKVKEIILINDNSLDNTLEILKDIKKNNDKIIKIFNFTKNNGPSFSRNFGVKKAVSDYVLFMDSDDIASKYLIEKSISQFIDMSKRDNYVLSYTSYFQIDEDDNIVNNIVKSIEVQPKEILGYEFLRNYVITSGVLISKENFYRAGKFNEKITYSEDWDLWIRVAMLGGFIYIDEPLIKVRRRKESLSSNVKNMRDGEIVVLKQYDLAFIEEAIHKRNLPNYINHCDFVSILFRMNQWEKGFEKLTLLKNKYNYYNL